MKNRKVMMAIEAFFVCLMFLLGYNLGASSASAAMAEVTYEQVHVASGDRLWDICKEYCPAGMDIREYISSTMRLNNMKNSDIYPGDVIKVRVYVDGP